MSAPRTTRRGLLGAGAAMLLTGAASPAAAVHVGAVPAEPHADAELLAALAEFDQIVIEKRAAFAACRTIADEEAIEQQIEPLEVRQDELLDLICTTPARTVAGVRARARSLVLWHGEWIARPDDPEQYHDKRLIAALVRDLVAET
jgi:hypothetical protein